MIPAGTDVDVTITYLEMHDNPGMAAPALPASHRLEKAENPPVWYFLMLYDAVGQEWEWRDRHEQAAEDLAGFVTDPLVELWTLSAFGWPQGFFQLDFRETGVVDLAYFGLVPQAVGGGLGKLMLQTAIAKGWDRDGVKMMSVNTCTLDHPRALGLYQSHGFRPKGTEFYTRRTSRDRVAPLAKSA